MSFTNTPLYGGAITLDIPSTFADASQIRQIPDHQEVYLDAAGYASIVVEILEYVEQGSDEAALQFHFGEVVEGTGDATTVLEQRVEGMRGMPNHPIHTLTFLQTPQPPNPNPRRKVPDFTYIHLLLLRLKEQATDIMVTINIPHYAGEYEKPEREGAETALMRESRVVRERVLESFEIREWGLFEG